MNETISHLSISSAVRELESNFGVRCSRRLLSGWFYNQVLDVNQCPIRDGRRQIPVSYLPEIARTIKRRTGRIPNMPEPIGFAASPTM
jgi:hypothetical protein